MGRMIVDSPVRLNITLGPFASFFGPNPLDKTRIPLVAIADRSSQTDQP